MTHFRIVRDTYAGYEVQQWSWWFPFWVQAGFSNTHTTLEKAEEWATRYARPCVKYLGTLSQTSAERTTEP